MGWDAMLREDVDDEKPGEVAGRDHVVGCDEDPCLDTTGAQA